MLRFDDIVTIADVGLGDVTSHSLSVEGAYVITRFKLEVKRLVNEYVSRYNALPKEVGIEDTKIFDKRKKELTEKTKRSKEEEKEFGEINDKLVRLEALRDTLLSDEVEINVKPMPWSDWHNLKQENKEVMASIFNMEGKEIGKRELFELIEGSCENILWKAPEE